MRLFLLKNSLESLARVLLLAKLTTYFYYLINTQ